MMIPSPGLQNIGLFMGAVMLLNITPGPDTAYIIGRSTAQGKAAGLMSAAGISAGCLIHSLLCAFGLTAILAASAAAFMTIKITGGLYLIYLGLRMLLSRAGAEKMAEVRIRSMRQIFLQAMLTNLLNPKVILFFLAFFPQFVQENSTHRILAFLCLGMIFCLMSWAWNSMTAILAGTLSQKARNHPHTRQWLEKTVGAAFIALGARLLLTRH